MYRLKIILKLWLAICLLLSLSSCTLFKSKSTFSIEFINVGQGDAALIECDGHYMLVDGGPKDAGEKVRNVLVDKNVNHLDILAVSHIHEDHIGGLSRVLAYATTVDLTLCPQDNAATSAFTDFYNELSTNGGSITIPRAGDVFKLGSASVEVLDCGPSENDGIILLITFGKTTFLFTGDMEHSMEERLCQRYSYDHSVSLLKVAHHGSETSTSIMFLRTFLPKYAVISVGVNNGYGHPSEGTLSRLDQAEVTVYRTDRNGNIFVYSDGETLSIDTER